MLNVGLERMQERLARASESRPRPDLLSLATADGMLKKTDIPPVLEGDAAPPFAETAN